MANDGDNSADGNADLPEGLPEEIGRTTRLLSNDLLDELGPSTPPSEAYRVPGTPSEPGSPPRQLPLANLDTIGPGVGLGSTIPKPSDVWDWKTDVPEFVPSGNTSLSNSNACGSGNPSAPVTPIASNMWAVTTTAIPSGATVPVANAMSWGTVVPVNVAGGGSSAGAQPVTTSVLAGAAPNGNAASNENDEVAMQQVRAEYEWQVQRQNEEIRMVQQRMSKLERVRSDVKAKWEDERQDLIREISRYVGVLTRYAIPLEEACEGLDDMTNFDDMDWTCDMGFTSCNNIGGKTLPQSTAAMSLDAKMKKLNGLLFSADSSCMTNAEDTPWDQQSYTPCANAEHGGDYCSSAQSDSSSVQQGAVATKLQTMFPHATIRTQNNGDEYAEGNRQLKASDEIPQEEDNSRRDLGDGDVRQLAEHLEQLTNSVIDDRAMRALQSLSPSDACDVLRKVDDLVEAQGGKCRNLSSILQSVCRKLERRAASRSAADIARSTDIEAVSVTRQKKDAWQCGSEPADACGSDREDVDSGDGDDATTRKSRRRNRPRRRRGARALESEGEGAEDTKCDVGQEGDGFAEGHCAQMDSCETAGSRRRRRRRGRGADLSDPDDANSASGADDLEQRSEAVSDGAARDRRQRQSGKVAEASAAIDIPDESIAKSSSSAFETPSDDWTTRRVERVANKGFEFKWDGESWNMRVSMASIDPPWTDAAMERYCAWLRRRLASIREEHGVYALRRCCGDIDFSGNALGDKGIWMLLEVLSQCEVQAAVLRLFNNRIGQGGALAICEFIRTNKRAQSVHELHLAHNAIDDDSAFELLRTLNMQKGRYPPRRFSEDGSGNVLVPVWVHLSHNRIGDPTACLRALEAEGISYCSARNSHGCGPGKCARGDCPVAHLYLFAEQAEQAPRRRFRGREARESWREEPDEAWASWNGSSKGPTANAESWSYADDGDEYGTLEGGGGSRRRRNRKSRRGYGHEAAIQHQ